MENIQVTARFKIHDARLDEFKRLAEACVQNVREKDTGTLQYDWFFNKNHTECVVLERYMDSDAVLEHMGNLGDLLGSLLELSDLDVTLYGAASEKLLEAAIKMDVAIFSFFKGLES